MARSEVLFPFRARADAGQPAPAATSPVAVGKGGARSQRIVCRSGVQWCFLCRLVLSLGEQSM